MKAPSNMTQAYLYKMVRKYGSKLKIYVSRTLGWNRDLISHDRTRIFRNGKFYYRGSWMSKFEMCCYAKRHGSLKTQIRRMFKHDQTSFYADYVIIYELKVGNRIVWNRIVWSKSV